MYLSCICYVVPFSPHRPMSFGNSDTHTHTHTHTDTHTHTHKHTHTHTHTSCYYSLFIILFSIYFFVCIFMYSFFCFHTQIHTHTHTHTHTHMAGRLLGSWRSVCPPVSLPDCPTDSSSHFCPKNSVDHRQKTLTHRVFVMKINQPSRPRLWWTFPQISASVLTSESDSIQFTDDDHVIM